MYKDYAEHLFNNGYPTVPIQPGTKRPIDGGWSKEEGIEPIRRHIAEHPTWGVGIINIPAGDADIGDEQISQAIEGMIAQIDPGYLKRVGQAPRFLVPFNAASEVCGSSSIWYDPALYIEGGDTKQNKPAKNQIEFLQAGSKQFLAYAIHPDTNAPYTWFNSSPWQTPAKDLRVWTAAEVHSLYEAFDQICKDRGFIHASSADEVRDEWSPAELELIKNIPQYILDTGPGPTLGGGHPDVSFDLLTKLIHALPAEKYLNVQYKTWCDVGMAIYNITGGSDEGFNLFDAWSATGTGYNGREGTPESVWSIWSGFQVKTEGVGIGIGSIYYWLQQSGVEIPREAVAVAATTAIPVGTLTLSPSQEAIAELNDRWGWTTIGEKSRIIDTTAKDELKTLTSKTFTEKYGNRFIRVTNAAGNEVRKPLGDSWLKDKNRRDFKGIYFHPSKTKENWYNLYNGFAVAPAATVAPELMQLYKWHVDNIICSKEAEMVQYAWSWSADTVQHPDEKKGVALALKGGRGTGKGFFAQPLGSLWGNHFLHLTNPAQLIGRFNKHLANKLLIFVDEAFWSATKKGGEGVLKGLITEAKIPIEGKGVDVVNVDNFCKFITASNEEWNIPAGVDERRFCCIEVSDAKAKDHKYFAALAKEIRNPLFAPTLLRYLMDYKYDCDYVRKAPESAALTSQKLHSLNNIEEYWYEVLQAGAEDSRFRSWEEEDVETLTSGLYDNYKEWCNEKHRLPIKARNSFCKELFGRKGLCADAQQFRNITMNGNGERGYRIPKLSVSRSIFEKYTASEKAISW